MSISNIELAAGARREHLREGARFPGQTLVTIHGDSVRVPSDGLVHVQLRRFAGCPVCNLHLRSFVRRHDEIEAAGVREVVLFHSTADELRLHATNLPFAVVADPEKRIYAALGAEVAPRALLDPRAWGAIVLGVLRSVWAIVFARAPVPPLVPRGGSFGLPADFLVARDGRVVACKYGVHADDQWSVDEVLAYARRAV